MTDEIAPAHTAVFAALDRSLMMSGHPSGGGGQDGSGRHPAGGNHPGGGEGQPGGGLNLEDNVGSFDAGIGRKRRERPKRLVCPFLRGCLAPSAVQPPALPEEEVRRKDNAKGSTVHAGHLSTIPPSWQASAAGPRSGPGAFCCLLRAALGRAVTLKVARQHREHPRHSPRLGRRQPHPRVVRPGLAVARRRARSRSRGAARRPSSPSARTTRRALRAPTKRSCRRGRRRGRSRGAPHCWGSPTPPARRCGPEVPPGP